MDSDITVMWIIVIIIMHAGYLFQIYYFLSTVTWATKTSFINIVNIITISIILTHIRILFRSIQISMIEYCWAQTHVNKRRHWIDRGFSQCCMTLLGKITIQCATSDVRYSVSSRIAFYISPSRFSSNSPFHSQINFHVKKTHVSLLLFFLCIIWGRFFMKQYYARVVQYLYLIFTTWMIHRVLSTINN